MHTSTCRSSKFPHHPLAPTIFRRSALSDRSVSGLIGAGSCLLPEIGRGFPFSAALQKLGAHESRSNAFLFRVQADEAVKGLQAIIPGAG